MLILIHFGINGGMPMGHIGMTELLVIGGIALIIFGPSRLPELGKGMGKALKGFKDAISGKPDEEEKKETSPKPRAKKDDKKE